MGTVRAITHLYAPCPGCASEHRADQLGIGQSTTWSCNRCHKEFHIKRSGESEFETGLTGVIETPVTVTLRSVTAPPITVRLNTWKYAHSQNDSKEEYEGDQQYFYNEHTCPTNWLSEVEQLEFEGDTDPHGLFEFVSVQDGHIDEEARDAE